MAEAEEISPKFDYIVQQWGSNVCGIIGTCNSMIARGVKKVPSAEEVFNLARSKKIGDWRRFDLLGLSPDALQELTTLCWRNGSKMEQTLAKKVKHVPLPVDRLRTGTLLYVNRHLPKFGDDNAKEVSHIILVESVDEDAETVTLIDPEPLTNFGKEAVARIVPFNILRKHWKTRIHDGKPRKSDFAAVIPL